MSESKGVRVVSARVPVRDGFTSEAVYKPDSEEFGAGTAIKFRPALQEEVADFLDDPRKFTAKAREMLLSKLTGWNVSDDAGTDVAPITAETLAEIHYPVFAWMVDAVTGYAKRQEAADLKN